MGSEMCIRDSFIAVPPDALFPLLILTLRDALVILVLAVGTQLIKNGDLVRTGLWLFSAVGIDSVYLCADILCVILCNGFLHFYHKLILLTFISIGEKVSSRYAILFNLAIDNVC